MLASDTQKYSSKTRASYIKMGFDLKNKISGDEDFRTPILFLFMYSMLWVYGLVGIAEKLNAYGSIVINEPILFADNVFETIGNFCWFLLPAAIFFTAIYQKQLLLKFTYLFGILPLVLTDPVINKIGYKSLYIVKLFVTLAVIFFLMKYLINTTDLYKKALKHGTKADCQTVVPNCSQIRRP